MKVAILLAGHMRMWDFCKENFMTNLMDKSCEIDVFVDTYDRLFRSDYMLHGEHLLSDTLSLDDVRSRFDGINVVSCVVEPEQTGDAGTMQVRKLNRVFQQYTDRCSKAGSYDLCVRSRFDIVLKQKFDYASVYNRCLENQKRIYIGAGMSGVYWNDMFCASMPDVFRLYMTRHDKYTGCVHTTLERCCVVNNLSVEATVDISVVRPNKQEVNK